MLNNMSEGRYHISHILEFPGTCSVCSRYGIRVRSIMWMTRLEVQLLGRVCSICAALKDSFPGNAELPTLTEEEFTWVLLSTSGKGVREVV